MPHEAFDEGRPRLSIVRYYPVCQGSPAVLPHVVQAIPFDDAWWLAWENQRS